MSATVNFKAKMIEKVSDEVQERLLIIKASCAANYCSLNTVWKTAGDLSCMLFLQNLATDYQL